MYGDQLEVNDAFMIFINTIRPRPLLGEIQLLAAFCQYLNTEDVTTIPGYGLDKGVSDAK
jgi:hypothetical protein